MHGSRKRLRNNELPSHRGKNAPAFRAAPRASTAKPPPGTTRAFVGDPTSLEHGAPCPRCGFKLTFHKEEDVIQNPSLLLPCCTRNQVNLGYPYYLSYPPQDMIAECANVPSPGSSIAQTISSINTCLQPCLQTHRLNLIVFFAI